MSKSWDVPSPPDSSSSGVTTFSQPSTDGSSEPAAPAIRSGPTRRASVSYNRNDRKRSESSGSDDVEMVAARLEYEESQNRIMLLRMKLKAKRDGGGSETSSRVRRLSKRGKSVPKGSPTQNNSSGSTGEVRCTSTNDNARAHHAQQQEVATRPARLTTKNPADDSFWIKGEASSRKTPDASQIPQGH